MSEKRHYFQHFWTDKGFQVTVVIVNQALVCLQLEDNLKLCQRKKEHKSIMFENQAFYKSLANQRYMWLTKILSFNQT